MAGEWHSIVLPHFPNTKHGGSAALAVNWKMWGIDQRELPQLPHYIEQELDEQDCEVSLSSEILDQAIDFLKAYAVTMEPLPGPNPGNADDLDDELLIRNSEYSSIRRCVSVLDSVLAGLDASAFARSARDMTGKGSGFWNGTRRPYQVAFLVKAVTLASLLRSASTMHEVLQSAARMLPAKCDARRFPSIFGHLCETYPTCEYNLSVENDFGWKLYASPTTTEHFES